MSTNTASELLELNQQLLNAIAAGDWLTYANLCDPTISCFETEAIGHLVEGLDFHKFYFPSVPAPADKPRPQNTMCSPHVRVMGDVAVIAYYRLTQFVDAQGAAGSRGTEETRVWHRQNGKWKHVHFHRSPSQKA